MARFHSREIGVLLNGQDAGEIALQAHFEGLVYAGVSAEEKLMRSLELLTASETGARTNRVISRLRGHSETERLGQRLARWAAYRFDNVNLVGEARAIRNVATHEFYDRRVGTEGDEWYFQVRRGRVVYSGSVGRFAAAYAAHVDELGQIAGNGCGAVRACAAERAGIGTPPRNHQTGPSAIATSRGEGGAVVDSPGVRVACHPSRGWCRGDSRGRANRV